MKLFIFTSIIALSVIGIVGFFSFDSVSFEFYGDDSEINDDLFIFDSETALLPTDIQLPDYIKQIHFTKINYDAFDSETISLIVFGDSLSIINDKITTNDNSFSWIGTITGNNTGIASFEVFDNGDVYGDLRMGYDIVTIKPYENDVFIIRDINSSKFPED
jgi:hypothetical protein